MSKAFAWILFISSVVCFVLQFRTQQLAVAADQLRHDADRPIPASDWQTATADADDVDSGVGH